jgi:hypothetical protein
VLRLLFLLSLLLLLAAGCSDNGDQCPAEFKPGDPCKIVGLICAPPTAECEDTKCVCSDEQAGGFFWDCSKVPYCKCTCFCGKIAVNTCEALGCTRNPADPCPAKAAGVCGVVCADAGPPDAGPDLPRPDWGPPDGPVLDKGPAKDHPVLDLPADQGTDLQPDQVVDQAGLEQSIPDS